MRRLILLSLCVAGCGGGPFNGTWAGQVVFSDQCSDGTAPASNPELVLTLSQSGSTVTISGLSCPLTGTVVGNQVNVNSITCPTDANGNSLGYTGGSLQLEAPQLIVDIFTQDVLKSGATCAGSISAPMNPSSNPPQASWNPYK